MSDNTCVCCGEIIPEGRQVCPACELKVRPDLRPDRILDNLKKLLTIRAEDMWKTLGYCTDSHGSDGAETKRVRAIWATYDEVLRMLEDPDSVAEELKLWEAD